MTELRHELDLVEVQIAIARGASLANLQVKMRTAVMRASASVRSRRWLAKQLLPHQGRKLR